MCYKMPYKSLGQLVFEKNKTRASKEQRTKYLLIKM